MDCRRKHYAYCSRQVRNAVSRGDIIIPYRCDCGDLAREAHHDDYSKPLEVEWYCKRCHRKLHDLAQVIDNLTWLISAKVEFDSKEVWESKQHIAKSSNYIQLRV